jgi:hypothetical protein
MAKKTSAKKSAKTSKAKKGGQLKDKELSPVRGGARRRVL